MSDAPQASPIPLSAPALGGNEVAYVTDAVGSGWLAAGSYIGRFEDALRDLTASPHAVACSSGTAALHVALLLTGVLPGDAVIVPTLTFAATCNAVRYCGAAPVFAGCDDSLCLDADALRGFLSTRCERDAGGVLRETASGRRIACVVPVHVFGTPCSPDVFAAAGEAGVPVVEDAAESLGSTWTAGPLAGRHTGTVGAIGVLSFNGNKVATTGGGGMLLTADGALAARARYLIDQAKDDPVRYIHESVGFNYRLPNPLAAIGLAQVEALDRFIVARRSNFALYRDLLAGVRGVRLIEPPAGVSANMWFFPLVVEPAEAGLDREQLMAALDRLAIQSRPIWYPNHLLRPNEGTTAFGVEKALWYWERVLCLPCGSGLTESDVRRVAGAIASAVDAARA